MVMSSFMTSKGPPKPSFWQGETTKVSLHVGERAVFRGLLPQKSSESRDRLMSGPGGRPEADGEQLLEPEAMPFTCHEGFQRLCFL